MKVDIKAVIFDYGNVLCELQPREDVAAIAKLAGLSSGELTGAYWEHRRVYDEAGLTPQQYWDLVAERPVEPEVVRALLEADNRSWTHPREKTLPWVVQVRSLGLKAALLSNLPVGLRDALENGAAPWLPEFDARTYSCDVRKAKPDPAIYADVIRKLGVQPSEAVLIDDRPENVEGAYAAGIHAVLYETAEQTAAELARRWNVNVRTT
jgi:putative hydrolase of the HAD superfamily